MSSQAALRAAKNELRSVIKTKLSSLPSATIYEQSTRAFETIIREKPYTDAKTISIYLSMPHRELETDSIVRHALFSGKRVFVPYLHKNEDGPQDMTRVMDMVELEQLEEYESLGRDEWGIPSLNPNEVEGRERILGEKATSHQHTALDLILMPGVAFDKDDKTGRIRRLGHGKGFYDLFLDRYYKSIQNQSSRHYPFLCGLALKEQFLQAKPNQQIPVGPLDRLLDAVVVGDGTIIGQLEKASVEGGDVACENGLSHQLA